MSTIYIPSLTLLAVVKRALPMHGASVRTFLLSVSSFAGTFQCSEDSCADGAEAIVRQDGGNDNEIALVRCMARLAHRRNL